MTLIKVVIISILAICDIVMWLMAWRNTSESEKDRNTSIGIAALLLLILSGLAFFTLE